MNNKNIHIEENKILLNKTKINKGDEKLNNELINYRYDDNNQKKYLHNFRTVSHSPKNYEKKILNDNYNNNSYTRNNKNRNNINNKFPSSLNSSLNNKENSNEMNKLKFKYSQIIQENKRLKFIAGLKTPSSNLNNNNSVTNSNKKQNSLVNNQINPIIKG
jgi:hypothetical protein